eukprot:1345624-Amorphochlora_amoeboformis.AAC.1
MPLLRDFNRAYCIWTYITKKISNQSLLCAGRIHRSHDIVWECITFTHCHTDVIFLKSKSDAFEHESKNWGICGYFDTDAKTALRISGNCPSRPGTYTRGAMWWSFGECR